MHSSPPSVSWVEGIIKYSTRGAMIKGKQPLNQQDDTPLAAFQGPVVEVVAKFRKEETTRFKKRVLSLIFVGMLISILIHLNIGFLLSLLLRDGQGDTARGAITNIEFAILDSEILTDLPTAESTLTKDVSETQAMSESLEATQATLDVDDSPTKLQASIPSSTPSLSGSGSSGMGSGMGGSGGGGTSFFGISSKGTRFCYIVDVSGSMKQNERLSAAIAELTKSLKKLPDFGRFYILFYSSDVQEPAGQSGWNTARSSTVRRLIREFESIQARGGTNPRPAFEQAFKLKPLPEVIFFLTDGEISGFTVDDLKALIPNSTRVTVNTIAFGANSSQQILREIAQATGGQFNYVQTGAAP